MEKWRTLKYVASQRCNKNLQLPTSYIGQGRIKATVLRVRVLFQNADPLAHVYPVNLLFYDAFLHFTKLPVRVSLYIIGQTWTIVY